MRRTRRFGKLQWVFVLFNRLHQFSTSDITFLSRGARFFIRLLHSAFPFSSVMSFHPLSFFFFTVSRRAVVIDSSLSFSSVFHLTQHANANLRREQRNVFFIHLCNQITRTRTRDLHAMGLVYSYAYVEWSSAA
jgi:hypothetical protein